MRWLAWLAVGAVGCATTSPSATSAEAARNGIAEGNRLLAAAVEVGNADRIATVFADDATLLDFSLPSTIRGHVAIAEYWRKRLATTRFLEAELITTEVSVAGDSAYEVGTSRATTQTGEAPPVVSTGRYLAVWRLGGGGRWRIVADSFMPDAPP